MIRWQPVVVAVPGAAGDQITVNIKVDYSGTGGGAAAGPDNGQYVSYTTVRADLVNNATAGTLTFQNGVNGFLYVTEQRR